MALPPPKKPTARSSPNVNPAYKPFRPPPQIPGPSLPYTATASQTRVHVHVQPLLESKQNNCNGHGYPQMFDPKYNHHCDWNELYYIAIAKGRILHAYNAIQQHYHAYLSDYDHTIPDNLPNIPDLCTAILRFIYAVFRDTFTVVTTHTMLHSHKSWTPQIDNVDGISIWYRCQSDTRHKAKQTQTQKHKSKSNATENYSSETQSPQHNILELKIQFYSQYDPLNLLAVINEFDLLKELVTIVPMETFFVAQHTEVDKIAFSKLKMWWPLNDRDAVVHVRAFDVLDDYDAIVISGHSVNEQNVDRNVYAKVQIPNVENGTTRTEVRTAEAVIEPQILKNGEFGTKVIAGFEVNFNMFLPQKIINWISRTFAFYVVKAIRQRASDLKGTTYQQRMQENEVYKEWRDNLQKWKAQKLKSKQTKH